MQEVFQHNVYSGDGVITRREMASLRLGQQLYTGTIDLYMDLLRDRNVVQLRDGNAVQATNQVSLPSLGAPMTSHAAHTNQMMTAQCETCDGVAWRRRVLLAHTFCTQIWRCCY